MNSDEYYSIDYNDRMIDLKLIQQYKRCPAYPTGCNGLQDKDMWEGYQDKDDKYICTTCKDTGKITIEKYNIIKRNNKQSNNNKDLQKQFEKIRNYFL